ncbi:MAG: hypothetical protein GX375_07450 [Clostridiales bacterium]|nr:hypothetical protein [Clostridiales bacterium]
MKRFWIFISCVLLYIASTFGGFIGSNKLFEKGETSFDIDYLRVFTEEEDAYYLQKASEDIVFYIDTSENNLNQLFTLEDENGTELNVPAKRVNGTQFKIMPPSEGYEAGKQYKLVLDEGASFSGDTLNTAKELTFAIEKEATEKYEYTEEVKPIEESKITIIEEDRIQVEDNNISLGDIFIDENMGEAYKVVEILGDGTAKVEVPALDEIFSELEVYGEYTWDVNEFVNNPEIEIEIVENFRSSSFFASLVKVAYAEEEPPKDVDISVKCDVNDDDNTAEIEVELTFYPGKKGLFNISALKDHEVTITFKNLIGMKAMCNIDGPVSNLKFDFSTTVTNELSWTVGISKGFDSEQIKSQLDAKIKESVRKLAREKEDSVDGDMKLFEWNLRLPSIPLIKFGVEVKIFTDLEMSTELIIGSHSKTITTVGLYFGDGEFRPYKDVYSTPSAPTIALTGKAELKTGLKLVAKVVIVNEKVAFIEVDPQAGLYTDFFVTWPVKRPEELKVRYFPGYLEAGVYFSADINAYVNLLVKKYGYSTELIEAKAPIVKIGNNKIPLGISSSRATVRGLNTTFTAPMIVYEYFDITSGRLDSEAIDIADIEFTVDGNVLDKRGNEVAFPENGGTSFYVTATYKDEDLKKSFSTLFKVMVSGSDMEGRVSEYTTSSEYKPITNATVKLYANNNRTTPLQTARTNDSGKFSFNVTEGTYVLRITAPGYKELTSVQEVQDGESKFTEHILLVDNEQTGNGEASGIITNAINGMPEQGVEIRLRDNWNNNSGGYVSDFTTTTDSAGRYSISEIPVGYYSVEAKKDGYYTAYYNIIVHASEPNRNQTFSISPILPENQLRIVLRWNEHPRDLDSHLIGKKPDGSKFNVYYRDMSYRWDSVEMANLDVDDTTSYGPETITIMGPLEDGWIYAVHDYTNKHDSESEAMSYSGAYITVFKGGSQIASFNIPVGQKGTYWTVFEYVDGKIRPINTIGDTQPIP